MLKYDPKLKALVAYLMDDFKAAANRRRRLKDITLGGHGERCTGGEEEAP